MGIEFDDCCRSLTGDEARFPPGGISPLVVDVGAIRKNSELVSWLRQQRSQVQSRLLRHGAILFRAAGGIRDAADFEEVAQALEPELATTHPFDDGPRPWRAKHIWDASGHVVGTPQAGSVLAFHNEDSYIPVLPRRLLFCSLRAPSRGGETSLTDCRRVLADIPKSTLAKVTERDHRVRVTLPIEYVMRNTGLRTAAEAEAFARARSGAEVAVEADRFVFTSARSAVAVHPETGERVWLNRLKTRMLSGYVLDHLLGSLNARGTLRFRALARTAASVWKPRLASSLLKGLLGLERHPDGLSAVDEWHIVRAYWKNAVLIRWRSGDFMILDNILMAHGRMPFRGDRDIVGALVP